MKFKLLLLIFLIVQCYLISCSPEQKSTISGIQIRSIQNNLNKNISRTLESDIFNDVNVGILITTADNENILFKRDEKRPYITASTFKVISSAVSLVKLGPDHQFKTPLLTDGRLSGDTLNGNLYISGKGDPGLKIDNIHDAVDQLRKKGLKRINGDIIYDVSYLDKEENRYKPNARNLYAPPGALNLNYNWIDVRVIDGSPAKLFLNPETSYARLTYNVKVADIDQPGRPVMTFKEYNWGDHFNIQGTITRWDKKYHYVHLGVSRPGLFTATILQVICKKKGIIITGKIREGRTPENADILSEIRSVPLKETVRVMNQESNNVIAETLNKVLGAEFISLPGTREKGLKVLKKFCILDIGMKENEFSIGDASGLSVNNRFSAYNFVKSLNYFYKDRKIRKALLPTLALQGHHPHAMIPVPPDHIKVLVKTGTLSVSGVNTVIGYILIESGPAFSFAVLANRKRPGPMTYSGTLTNPILTAIVNSLKEIYPIKKI
ncbi:MAG: D-alanyl-D-alanine carboxypeptidase/D-alanyl-D-alanine-endopeptidase [Spirochaetes bacterium]|nr:D-alanyl-D-alanine carboxypeptidase/D-alanyl-D-alanine-endopeptidase [Spirochaetota bacterium]